MGFVYSACLLGGMAILACVDVDASFLLDSAVKKGTNGSGRLSLMLPDRRTLFAVIYESI